MQHTTEYIRADVGRTTTLVTKQVTVANEMFAEAEVGDGDSASARVQHHVTELQVSMHDVPLDQTQTLITCNLAVINKLATF